MSRVISTRNRVRSMIAIIVALLNTSHEPPRKPEEFRAFTGSLGICFRV